MVAEASIVSLHAAPEGGVPKPAVPNLHVTVNGCVGDRQRDLKHHGGPTRALCIWSREVLLRFVTKAIRCDRVTWERTCLCRACPFPNSLRVTCSSWVPSAPLDWTCSTVPHHRAAFTSGPSQH